MRVCFGGDLFLGGDLACGDASPRIEVSLFINADARIASLEQAISDRQAVADKCTLHSGSDAVIHLQRLRMTAVNLAQNHIHDKGDEGISDTARHLAEAGIGCFGAGANAADARRPYWLAPGLALLGYCDYDRPYLRDVRSATAVSPGVSPLRRDAILDDLSRLPQNAKAMLFFHWGREHVWLPPHDDIRLAEFLLADDRVAGIIGTHAHRMQGYISHSGKRAYMCLGNLLFPNFYIEPPTQISYPVTLPDDAMVTRGYHSVSRLTYKKWPLRNRVSMVLEYDTASSRFRHVVVVQDDDAPTVREVVGAVGKVLLGWVELLALVYRAPSWVYTPLEWISTRLSRLSWRAGIQWFRLRQNGLGWLVRKLWAKLATGAEDSRCSEHGDP